jgi:hypothetical protein
MARLDEIAEGVVTVLRVVRDPEPLGIDLWNHTPAEVAFLVRAVVDACERTATPLTRIHVSSDLAGDLDKQLQADTKSYEGISIISSSGLVRRMELFRFPPQGAH